MDNQTLISSVSQLIAALTGNGVGAQRIYIVFRAHTLALEHSIEKIRGPEELAGLQEISFDLSRNLHVIEIRIPKEEGTA